MSRATLWRSINSDISKRSMERSSSNKKLVKVRASSVLPTPVGPKKRKLPMGFLGSLRPTLARLMAAETADTAVSWPMTLLPNMLSIVASFSRSD